MSLSYRSFRMQYGQELTYHHNALSAKTGNYQRFFHKPAPYFAQNSPSGNSEDVTFFMCSRDSAGVIAQFVGYSNAY